MQTTWLERGTVSGRVALLLRSAEIQPLFERFVRLQSIALSITPPLTITHNTTGADMLQGGFDSGRAFNHPPLNHNTQLVRICSRAGLILGGVLGGVLALFWPSRGVFQGARLDLVQGGFSGEAGFRASEKSFLFVCFLALG